MNRIDYTKPIRVANSSGRDFHPHVDVVYESGIAQVSWPDAKNVAGGTMLYDAEGNWLADLDHPMSRGGSALKLENAPEEKVLYLRMSTIQSSDGDGLSLHRNLSECDGAGVCSVKVTFVEGIVVSTEIVSPNELPFKRVALRTFSPRTIEDL